MTATGEPLEIQVGERIGRVSGLLLRPPEPWAGYVLAHGAGAGMTHPFMESVARALAARGVATLRYQFPYFEAGSRRPDPPGMLIATVSTSDFDAIQLSTGTSCLLRLSSVSFLRSVPLTQRV